MKRALYTLALPFVLASALWGPLAPVLAQVTQSGLGGSGGAPVSTTTGTFSSLTSGRVVFAGTGGLLSDDADLTFATDTLTATKGIGSTSLCGAGAVDAANSVCLQSSAILSEGSSADTSELTLAFGNHTTDQTVTLTGGTNGTAFTGSALGFGGDAHTGATASVLTATSATTTVPSGYLAMNDGALNAYGQSAIYGSAAASTSFGVARANAYTVVADGASLANMMVGTLTADPLTFGVNNEQRAKIAPSKALADNTIATFDVVTLGNDVAGGGTIQYCIYAADATTAASECGSVDFSAVDVTAGAGGEVCAMGKIGTPVQALSGATLATTFTATVGTDLCSLRITSDHNIATPVAHVIKWSLTHGNGAVHTPQ